MSQITAKIGSYGPGSIRIGNLVMLPDEASKAISEMIGQPLPNWEEMFLIKDISFDGVANAGEADDYGHIIAHCE